MFFALSKEIKRKKINFSLSREQIKEIDPYIHELRLLKSSEEISVVICDHQARDLLAL